MATSQRRVTKKLKDKLANSNSLDVRSGVIVSVGASTVTVTIGTDDIPGVPFYSSVTGLTTGSKVHVLLVGGSPVVIGKLA